MNTKTTMLHLRIDKDLQKNVKKLATSMGVSMSLVGETLFKKFLEERKLELNAEYHPNDDLKNLLEKSKKNRDNKKYWSSHNSIESLMIDLKK